MSLYACTVFLSAFLLFQIQPMITKIILPWFGGSAAVWITAMLFFQMVLLGGYLYAHWAVRSSNPKLPAGAHALLLLGSLALLPVWPDLAWKPTGSGAPIPRILGLLSLSVGLPYLLLSTTSPLIQAWYSRKHHQALPYRLFALSNLASLLGLIAYPFLVEPHLTLRQQSVWWSAGYAAFVLFTVILALQSTRNRVSVPAHPSAASEQVAGEAMPLSDQVICLALACCASTLMLAVTNHLTQNVAAVPFLWILPLSIYLLSFVLTFDLERLYHRKAFLWLTAAALVAMSAALLLWEPRHDIRRVILLFCVGLLICCIFCHGEVVKRKPSPRHLTSFYLLLSAGGALGGLLVGLGAPLALPAYFELPLALIASALLMTVVGYRDARRSLSFIWVLAALIVVYGNSRYITAYSRSAIVMCRNFYGSLRVIYFNQGSRDMSKCLYNGAILHGQQLTDPARRAESLLYYRPESGIGRVLRSLRPARLRVGVVGLGAGSLASYAQPGDLFRFYEINPLVERVARTEFTYLPECKGKVDVLIGDGRLLLEAEPPQRFDLLAVDAFSGDAIPVHLLTLQAMRVFLKHLGPNGILALHITNTHLDLEPVVERLARELGKESAVIIDKRDNGREISSWALISSDYIEAPLVADVAQELDSRNDLPLWTDDHNNLFQILK